MSTHPNIKVDHTTSAKPISGTRTPCYEFRNHHSMARHVAKTVASVIQDRNSLGHAAVLGLPTGSTPVSFYRELIRMHQEDGFSFANVIVFSMDEYFGVGPEQLQSYSRWLHEHLFDHIDIPDENIHLLNGTIPLDQIEAHCQQHEAAIARAGGMDIQLLGIGRNGHIGFNEPFSVQDSRTRLVTLDPITRRDAASDFFGEENVPVHALTIGLATMMDAKRILLLALGEHKAPIIRETLEEPTSERVPASILQQHPHASVLVDEAAASELTAVVTPWKYNQVEWTDAVTKRAVLWLCDKTGKSLLKLGDDDFRQHNLHQLLRRHGPAEAIAHRVFQWMMKTIQYHPSGKDPKRVICFSPHPDDDVISMGGTLIRLVEDGHETHVAYMTSGNIAVFDHDAELLADSFAEYSKIFGVHDERIEQLEQKVLESLKHKKPGEQDIEEVQKIKGLIRWAEAKAGARVAGCREEHLHFLDLPFYRTGTVKKDSVSEEDARIIQELLERVEPADIYVAGDLSDPHGTHRVCAEAIFMALEALEKAGKPTPRVLLYRGAWAEWAAHEIEIAVPLSPGDINRKRQAIFRHESQKDAAMFAGSDSREFWQRAEDRNLGTADMYNRFGLPEYFALEGFVEWDGVPI